MTSSPASSSHAPTNQTGSSPGAVEPSERETRVPEEISTGSEQHEQPETELSEQQDTSAEDESSDSKERLRHQQEADAEVPSRDPKGRLPQKAKRLTAKRKRAYLELFDEVSTDINAGVSEKYGNGYAYEVHLPLSGSSIAGSVWTRDEKERFFTALARCGRDDLPGIARNIGTKNELEVRLYLLALKAGVEDEADSAVGEKQFSRANAPAAYELSGKCEQALDAAANVLAAGLERQNDGEERTRFGDAWLVDADAAAKIDMLVDQPSESESDADDTSEGHEVAAVRATESDLLTPSTSFFDTFMLLQLSRNLFMNGPPNGHWNYHTAELLETSLPSSDGDPSSDLDDTEDQAPPEPAIYHSAINDLHALVKAVTRKLVNATLFQATSRLRAKDDSSPAPMVLASDVHIAADVLGFKKDWKAYWAKLPRRAGLEVYSESDKYKRGRMGTKNGVKLTYDEVEAELGLPKPANGSERRRNAGPDYLHTDAMNGDEVSTEIDSDADDSEVSSDGMIELKHEKERRKRRQGLSPDSFARAEERHMRALDQRADNAEGVRLRELLGLEAADTDEGEVEELLERPRLKKKSRREAGNDWREKVDGMAAWEVECVRKLAAGQDESENDEEMDGEDRSEDSDSEDGDASPEDADDANSGESEFLRSDDGMDDL